MNNLLDLPISSVVSLSAERAVSVVRAILRAECGYAKLAPSALTISSRLTVADGGIDAEVNTPAGTVIPADCMFQFGVTGFQIKAGTSFKPWTESSIRSELLDAKGNLSSEVQRLVERRGCYVLICTGHDLTPKQRNDSRELISKVLTRAGVSDYEELVGVFGASQLVEFAERYPGTASMLAVDPIQEAWVLDEWQCDAHMSNTFEVSVEQEQTIEQIRAGARGETKHIRILGEPGLGKTRIVLEALRAEDLAPYVLYLQHGSMFGQTKLFRQLLKSGWSKPLVLVLDELPELEMSDIWRHLKPRCGHLKLISMDHGRDETHDDEIERIEAPRLSDETIKKILMNRVGESRELDRWVAICEGSPRVAQAVADNLFANPGDLLRPPATVPIWARFLHGYGVRDDVGARQLDCVTQHLALFSRFGYEEPVAGEARYIAELIQTVDPTVGWGRFQEIVRSLRARRVLQGNRTLFFVPKALHIYLWKQFWDSYGRGFDFMQIFNAMPKSLHTWFLKMFRFAEGAGTAHVVEDILRHDGIFSDPEMITSANGSQFLSTLAEANPSSVLKLLEATIGAWTGQELLRFEGHRQNIVWALEKIAVWQPFTVRAMRLLARLAAHENANFSNNSTGTLVGLFRIGPEAAATEASPEARLPALLSLLRASSDVERRLGLQAAEAALETSGMGFRIVGPEYQGLKERAKLWIPATYGDWWRASLLYFQALADETRNWPSTLRPDVCQTLLNVIEQQIGVPPCTELAFQILETLITDPASSPSELNRFFWHWQEYRKEVDFAITGRLQNIANRYTRRSLTSRFQRYVIDVEWLEWDEDFRERHEKPKNRAKKLVDVLGSRIARNPGCLNEIKHLLAPSNSTPALWRFGEQLALNDQIRVLLPSLTRIAQETKHQVCLHGYLSSVKTLDPEFYHSWLRRKLEDAKDAWLGATIVLCSDYVDDFFFLCLEALEKRWIDPSMFNSLRYGKAIEAVPSERLLDLFKLLYQINKPESLKLVVELMALMKFDETFPCDSEFVLEIVLKTIPGGDTHDQMRGYYWKNACLKLVKWDPAVTTLLLNGVLTAMGENYRLSYDSDVEPMLNELVQIDRGAAWRVVREHFEKTLPQWRSDLFCWLKGGMTSFDEKEKKGAIAELPVPEIIEWIKQDVEHRAALMAHAASGTLDNDFGGELTRELLAQFGEVEGVRSGISASFHSGGWSGPTSAYLKRKREKLRNWLAAGYQYEVEKWIEEEIEYLDRRIEQEEIDEERSRFH